ncbi:MAG: hypothetical protein MUP60_03615 [Candidatus Thorarchaeota archaeon]|nr:hypothetical protein [Candidatus Thorarchaeota archaeon]
MPHHRFQISSLSIGSLSVLWVLSIIWLVGATPIVCTSPTITAPIQSSVPSGTPVIREPSMSIAPLTAAHLLMRGINMAWYTNTETFQYTLSDETLVEEDVTPYWFKIGFDCDILRADLDTLQLMGVRHIRISALIFQFLNWHPEFGSQGGLNASVIASFNSFLDEVESRGMILTVSFLSPLWSYSDHPSLMEYFRIFNETSSMSPGAQYNLGQAMVSFSEHYRTNDAIHTWEIVGGFSRFMEYLSNSSTGFGLTIDATELFDLFESVAEDIRAVDDEHFVTISDGWPLDYDAEWQATGLVPPNYDVRLLDATDYIALCHYSDNTTLNIAGLLHTPSVITEIGSSQLYNHSREFNSEILLRTYAEAINKSYSGFCPWEFSRNIVVHEENDTLPNHLRHDWTWDALLLYSLYRNDSVKFINTSNWYVLSSEPQFDWAGRVSFTLFLRPEGAYPGPFGFEDERIYDPAEGNTIIEVLSRNLLFSDVEIINQKADSEKPLFNLEALGTYSYATTLATIFDVGHVEETGIRVESNHTWESTVERYDESEIIMMLNASGTVSIEVKSGSFTLIEGNDYTISYTDRISGTTQQETLEADGNQSIRMSMNASSVTIRITLSPDVLGMISLGMSISVILISIVVFYYTDKRTPKE